MEKDRGDADKLAPTLLTEIAKLGAAEKPLAENDAAGAVPEERLCREVAARAWHYLAEFANPNERLPAWIVEYLIGVGKRVDASLGPHGALNRDDAHYAIGMGGKAWPAHPPGSVYSIMQGWIDDPTQARITGPTAAAKRYIEEFLDKGSQVRSSTILRLYREGKRLAQSDSSVSDT